MWTHNVNCIHWKNTQIPKYIDGSFGNTEPKPQGNAAEIKWVNLEYIDSEAFAFDHKKVLSDYKNGNKQKIPFGLKGQKLKAKTHTTVYPIHNFTTTTYSV